MKTNPYLEGAFAPVDRELTSFDLPVEGAIPPELEGRFLLIGPNPVSPQNPKKYQWFMGDGMVHGVRLEGGRAGWYRNRWIRSKAVTKRLGLPRAAGPRNGRFDIVNTSVAEMDGVTVAMVEGGSLPVQLTDELETIAYTDLEGTLPSGFTAHPKLDPATGEFFGAAYFHGRGYVQYVVVGKDGRARKVERIQLTGGTPMMHDISLTERFVVLHDLPVRFSWSEALRLRMPYQWKPGRAARFGVLPREGTAQDLRWFEITPCFVFHTFNAYEVGDTIVIDGIRYSRAFSAEDLFPHVGPLPQVWQWRIDLATGRVTETCVDERAMEMPKVDERRTGRRHRYGYSLVLDGDTLPTQPKGIAKLDLATGQTQTRLLEPGRVPSETTFVARDHASTEDDGWLMCYVYDGEREASDLVIYDAQDLLGRPVATIRLPARVPVGFHGSWLPDR